MADLLPAAPVASSSFDHALLDELIGSSIEPDWVAQLRREAHRCLEGMGLPDRRQENWMRTDLRLFRPGSWTLATGGAESPLPVGLLEAEDEKSTDPFEEAAAPQPVGPAIAGRFGAVDGHVLRDELAPDLARRGVLFGSAERLLAEHGERFRSHWFRVIETGCDWFAAVHAAFHRGSCVLYVPPGVRIAEPLHVLSAIGSRGVDMGHVLVVLDDGAEATLMTETASVPGAVGGGFHCGGTEIVVGRAASLRLVNLQNWNLDVWHFARQKAVVHERGRLQWTLGALGSRLSQVAQDVALVGPGADAQVNGVMFTTGRQQLVYNTMQHHEAASCRSDLLYKGGLQDRSRLVWRGMIKVDKSAQKTDGYQRNDNLMLSDAARADSIPGLEIEADDVRCTHGATSGRVDQEQIFYAQARGLTADEAARLVVAGFFQQVFDRITIPAVREALARAIGSRIRRIS